MSTAAINNDVRHHSDTGSQRNSYTANRIFQRKIRRRNFIAMFPERKVIRIRTGPLSITVPIVVRNCSSLIRKPNTPGNVGNVAMFSA